MDKYQGLITNSLPKVLKTLPKFCKNQKIAKHIIGNFCYVNFQYDNGTTFISLPTCWLNRNNIQFTELWLDKNIPAEVLEKEICPKYIGRKSDINWI